MLEISNRIIPPRVWCTSTVSWPSQFYSRKLQWGRYRLSTVCQPAVLTWLFQKKQEVGQTSEEYLEGRVPLWTPSWFGIACTFSLAYAYDSIQILIAAVCFVSAAKQNTLLAKSLFTLAESSRRVFQVAAVSQYKSFFYVVVWWWSNQRKWSITFLWIVLFLMLYKYFFLVSSIT